jgi:hypothetical protein
MRLTVLYLFLGLVTGCTGAAPSKAASRPSLRQTALRPLSSISSTIRSSLIVNEGVRGRDQRTLWLRGLAAVHPRIRVALFTLTLAAACSLWFRPGMHDDLCIIVSLGMLGSVCRAAIAISLIAIAAVGLASAIAFEAFHGAAEERKDTLLTEELLAAAAASAAYETAPDARLRELNTRGVESSNWEVDEELSTADAGIFVNRHAQAVVVAYRGTETLQDWASNLRRIVPGDEERSPSFLAAVATARAARDKYMLYKSMLLTGHSRGGSMADFAGRKLGLPSTTFNPASWGKVLKPEEPAARSVTAKTSADLVSVLEAFFPGDRSVRHYPPKRMRALLVLPTVAALCFIQAHLLLRIEGCASCSPAAAWLYRLCALALLLGALFMLNELHTVTNFTMR